MAWLIWLAAAAFVLTTLAHFVSLLLAAARCRQGASLAVPILPVTIVRPVCGIDNFAEATLASTFTLREPAEEIIFCVASAHDPALRLLNELVARYPTIPARVLIGNDRISDNPKLNNLVKGWRAAATHWVALIDSNVLLPHDFISRLSSAWRPETGLLSSPPLGCAPDGVCAEVECAFLNTYQARWQYAADAIGLGFAQGKLLFWRRADLDRAGGLERLAADPAEDAAATKVVREAGLHVELLSPPLPQPLGRRTLREVWQRQVRWARLRRATFPFYFAAEIISGFALPAATLVLLAVALDMPVLQSLLAFGLLWYGAEWLFAWIAGWHLRSLSPVAWFARDLLIPVLWLQAWIGRDFVWRGHAMTASAPGERLAHQHAGADSRD